MSTMMPPGDPGKATYAKDKEAIWREIRALWRLQKQERQVVRPQEVVFSFAGKPIAWAKSPPYQVRESVLVNRISVSVGTIGTGFSEVTVYLNDVVFNTAKVYAGEKHGFTLPDDNISDGDFLSVAVSEVGAGTKDFVVQVSW